MSGAATVQGKAFDGKLFRRVLVFVRPYKTLSGSVLFIWLKETYQIDQVTGQTR